MDNRKYSTDTTRKQWEKASQYIHRPKQGRKPKYQLQEVFNAILYIVHTGCQWRLLPNDFPPYYSVYYYFNKWKKDGTWFLMHQALHQEKRIKVGKKPEPTGAIIDTQSVKVSPMAKTRGFDGHKKVNGRKRHLVVDTLGFPLFVKVYDANIDDYNQAFPVLASVFSWFVTIKMIWADGAYGKSDYLALWLFAAYQCRLEIAPTLKSKGFNVVPMRWIVERTFGWFQWSRRLSIDYERRPDTAEALIYIASIKIMLQKL